MRFAIVVLILGLHGVVLAGPPSGYRCGSGRPVSGKGCACTSGELERRDEDNVAECIVVRFDRPAKTTERTDLGLAGCDDICMLACENDDAHACQAACATGRADSRRRMGSLFENGVGVAREGIRRMYRFGRGIAIDQGKAFAAYERACKLKEPAGCANLGVMYENGLGVPKDHAKALALYEGACSEGVGAACFWGSELYGNGEGITHDPEKAKTLRERACTLKYEQACRK